MTNATIPSSPNFPDSTQVIAKFTVIDTADATLSKLLVSAFPLTPAFNQNTLNYTVNVGCEVEQIEIVAKPTDLQATLSGDINTQQLVEGKNTFIITVTARDGVTTLHYTVVVNRCDVGIAEAIDNGELTIDNVEMYDILGRLQYRTASFHSCVIPVQTGTAAQRASSPKAISLIGRDSCLRRNDNNDKPGLLHYVRNDAAATIAPSPLERAGGEVPPGIYILKIHTNKGILTKKIIKSY